MLSGLLLRVSVVLLLVGLALGMAMGMRQDFTLMPAHAHLNLVGFVLMFAAGLFYRAFPAAAETLAAKVHATLHIIGAFVFPLGIAAVVTWGPAYEAGAIVGGTLVFVAMAIFAIVVFRATAGRRVRQAEDPRPGVLGAEAAASR